MLLTWIRHARLAVLTTLCVLALAGTAVADDNPQIYNPGKLPPTDSVLKVAVGEEAPDFTLPALHGKPVTLSDYQGQKNVVISFVPAAFTPICSGQWPGYKDFDELADILEVLETE